MKIKGLSFIVILTVILLLACSLKVANADPIRFVSAITYAADEGSGGLVSDPTKLVGHSDGMGAILNTEGYGDEAIIKGEMNDWAIGSIYLWVHTLYDHIPSFVVVSVSDDPNKPMGEWTDINYQEVSSTSWQQICVGIAQEPFRYIAVFCWGGFEGYGPLDNRIYVDAVAANPYVYYPFNPPPQPEYQPVTVNVCDNYGNPLAGDIYIDGDYAGQTSVTQYLVNSLWWGPHEISVDNVAGYAFQNFTFNGNTDFSNPMYLEVYEPVTIAAYFGPPTVCHWVTVDGYCENNEDPYFDPDGYNVLYIDGLYGYSLGWSYSLVEGTHTFRLDGYIDCGYWYYEFLYFTCDGNTYYSNTVNLPITSDKTIVAHYYLHLLW